MNNHEICNHKSPQAIQIFYGNDCQYLKKGITKRYVYGLKSVHKTTRIHPNNYRVNRFDEDLFEIIDRLKFVVKHALGSEWKKFQLDFNFLEMKIYLSNSMYGYAKENRTNTQSFRCKIIREHNDLEFDDYGVHLVNETFRRDHPIVTYTMESTRNLKFRWHSKGRNKTKSQWRPVSDSKEELKLHNGSIMVLLPDDEEPKEIDGMLYKIKHSASFFGDGMSIGFVFRLMKRN